MTLESSLLRISPLPRPVCVVMALITQCLLTSFWRGHLENGHIFAVDSKVAGIWLQKLKKTFQAFIYCAVLLKGSCAVWSQDTESLKKPTVSCCQRLYSIKFCLLVPYNLFHKLAIRLKLVTFCWSWKGLAMVLNNFSNL